MRLLARLRRSKVDVGPPQRDRDLFEKASTVSEFWELAHASNDSWWTSGTPFAYVRRVFALPDDLTDMHVLVVGVGQGNELRGLREAGALVSGLDISKAAHDRFGAEFPMFTEETLTGTFDLIVMHLVAQHMSNAQLSRMFGALSSRMADDSELHVQFACPIHAGQATTTDNTDEVSSLKGGSRTREILEVIALAERDFGIADLRVIGVFPEFSAIHLAATLIPRENLGSDRLDLAPTSRR